MESAAAQAGLKILITSREFLAKGKIEPPGDDRDGFPRRREGRHHACSIAGFRSFWRCWHRFECWSSAAAHSKPPNLDDTATIIFSSGSTGDPKGVVLSHFNIGSNIEAIAQVYRVLPNDRLMGFLPFFHSFGYTMFWFAASTGMGMICHPSPLDAAVIGSLVERFRGTVLLATPTFLQLYQRRCTPAQFGSLRLILVGAEKLPESLALSFEDTFGIRPMEGYGLTECSPVVAVNTFDWREPGYFQPGARRGYVGQPLPGVLVSIVSNETGEPLGPDEQGLVLVKGPNVMRGYLGRDDLTQAAFRDGWYITGDQGLLSEDGFLKITGRLSRFSKIGGEMVPHILIEEALNEAVPAATQLFAVSAVGDERKGEKLVVLAYGRRASGPARVRRPGCERPAQPVPSQARPVLQGRRDSDPGHRQARPASPAARWPKKPLRRRLVLLPQQNSRRQGWRVVTWLFVSSDGRGLLEYDLPIAADPSAHHDAPMVFLERPAFEAHFALPATADHGRFLTQRAHDDLGVGTVVDRVGRRSDDRQDRVTVHHAAVGSDINVVISHQTFDRSGVLVEPRAGPGFVQIL